MKKRTLDEVKDIIEKKYNGQIKILSENYKNVLNIIFNKSSTTKNYNIIFLSKKKVCREKKYYSDYRPKQAEMEKPVL